MLGETTPPENASVESWLDADPAHRRQFTQLQQTWELSRRLAATSSIDVDEQWTKFKQRVASKPHPRASWTWLRAAAAILLLGALAWISISRFTNQKTPATLAVESTDSVRVAKLPDGSEVTLNRHSVLTYPERFNSNQRSVTLRGEAFFSVTPDKKKPFRIQVNDVLVSVVGTSFNIRSYNGVTAVVVETGVVKVSRGGEVVELHPGEQTTILKDSAFNVSSVQDHLYNYYRSREFVCDNIPLWRLVEVVNEAYGSHLVCGSEQVRNLHYNGTFPDESLDRIVEVLQLTFKLTVRREGDQIILQ